MIGKAQRSLYQKRRKIVAAIHGIFPLGPVKHLTEFPSFLPRSSTVNLILSDIYSPPAEVVDQAHVTSFTLFHQADLRRMMPPNACMTTEDPNLHP
jgi:hypothetical protein